MQPFFEKVVRRIGSFAGASFFFLQSTPRGRASICFYFSHMMTEVNAKSGLSLSFSILHSPMDWI